MSGNIGTKLSNFNNMVFYTDPSNSNLNEIKNNLSGTLIGTTNLGNNISFNGTTDWISFPVYNNIQVSSVTIDCWFNPNTIGSTSQLFSILDWSNFNSGFPARGFSLTWNNNTIAFYYGDGFSVPCVVQTSPTISTLNKWCNIIVTYSSGSTKFYLNGTLLSTASGANSPIDWTYGSGIPSIISISKKNNTTGGYFSGNIGTIKVYNKELTATEVSINYNQLISRYS